MMLGVRAHDLGHDEAEYHREMLYQVLNTLYLKELQRLLPDDKTFI